MADKLGTPVPKPLVCIGSNHIVSHVYQGYLKIQAIDRKTGLPSSAANDATSYSVRLDETDALTDLAILPGHANLTLAVLYSDGRGCSFLKSYALNPDRKSLTPNVPWSRYQVEAAASHLICTPALPNQGLLVVGQKSVTYHNGSTTKAVPMATTAIATWGAVSGDGNRYILGDHTGALQVLVLVVKNAVLHSLHLEALGSACIPSTLTYLDEGFLYIGSCYGDPHLVKLNDTRDPTTGSYLNVVSTWNNLGPITDFSVVNLDSTASTASNELSKPNSQIVTCSGTSTDGSIRVIRNGIGVTEQASVEMPGVKGMWRLKSEPEDNHDRYLVQAFINETRILGINQDEMEEIEIPGFEGDRETLFASTIGPNGVSTGGSYLVQVTDAAINLVSCSTLRRVDTYTPPSKITVANGNETGQLVIACGNILTYLTVEKSKFTVTKSITLENEVSCIDCTPFTAPPAANADDAMVDVTSPQTTSDLVLIGLWNDNTLRLLTLPALDSPLTITLETQARSVIMATLEGKDVLMVGLGDGSLVSYELDSDLLTTSNRKKVSLGTQPITLSMFNSAVGSQCVFAASDRPTVVYSSNGKVCFANVNLSGEVCYVCPFNCEMFPNCLALASETELTIGTIDDIQKLHIQTWKLGEGPRKIVHHAATRTFVVTVDGPDSPAGGEDVIETSHTVVFLNDSTFDEIMRHKLEPFEVSLSLCNVSLADEAGDLHSFVAVGTAVAHPDEEEPTEGRILLFKITQNDETGVTTVRLAAEKSVRGGVYSLCNFKGTKLAAGVNSKVSVFKFKDGDGSSPELVNECSLHGHILALHLRCHEDTLLVGDLMRSMCAVQYDPAGGTLKEVARDYNANWMLDVEMIEPNFYVGADMSGNLFTTRRNLKAGSDEEKSRLEGWGEFHLGQMVNKFAKGRLGGGPGDSERRGRREEEDVLFATSNGSIGAIFSLESADFAFFGCLQKCLVKATAAVGGLDWDTFRSWKGERRIGKCKRFIDGDLLEGFLDMSREKQEEVVGLMEGEGGWDAGDKGDFEIGEDGRAVLTLELVLGRVEGMSRLHL
jgi:DNA damage-binding protein 1